MEPEPAEKEERSPATVEPYRCAYCGGSLDLRYHFCVHCGVVHRLADPTVYDPVEPPAPSLEERIAGEGKSALDLFFVLATVLAVSAYLWFWLGKERLGTFLVVQDILIAVATIALAVPHRAEILPLFRAPRAGLVLALALPSVAALLAANLGYHAVLTALLDLDRGRDDFERILETLSKPTMVVALCVFPAVFEEIGCRGLCHSRLVAALGRTKGFIGTSVIFAALHFNVLSAPYLFLVGMVLSWVRDGTGSLWPPMVLHFIHNAAVLFLFRGGAP